MAKPIYFFTKNDNFYELSNFASFGFEEDGKYWPTVEHYFQAMKFDGDEYEDYREQIRKSHSPKQAKAFGQSRKYPLRKDWEEVKEAIMLKALRLKFSHPKMKAILLSTKNRKLIENSPYDRYWGIGKNHDGKNRLGVLLMKVREEIKKEKKA